MKKIIETHRKIIARSEGYIDFMGKAPINKMIKLTCFVNPTYTKHAQEERNKKEDIQCIVKIIGFNNYSIRVRVIAIEKVFHPLSSLAYDIAKGRDAVNAQIKIDSLKDFTWEEFEKKELPLCIGYNLKTCLFEAILNGDQPSC